jgi:hypothetical protein
MSGNPGIQVASREQDQSWAAQRNPRANAQKRSKTIILTDLGNKIKSYRFKHVFQAHP